MLEPSTLPLSPNLPVEHLASSFNNVTNSYKFYWFLAILEHLQETQANEILMSELVARMISLVWYPANYFRLSFGKQDRLADLAISLRNDRVLSPNSPRELVTNIVVSCWQTPELAISQGIRSLVDYVPFRFLRPFFTHQLRSMPDWKVNGLIRQLSENAFESSNAPCLYRFADHGTETGIELHPLWRQYLLKNMSIVLGYTLWHLTGYLQKNNPNVPNIVGKLSEPKQRSLRQAREFWNVVVSNWGTCRCIYSDQYVRVGDFSIDHFLPWSFVAHDLLWNLVPTKKNVNSMKSDQLPDFEYYFDTFAQLQYQAVHTVAALNRDRLLEDHILLFRSASISDMLAMPVQEFSLILRDSINPQAQIARNMGFVAGWRYSH